MACFRSSRPPAASRWVAQKRWSDNWESIKEYPGGGQGVAKRVSRKSDGQEGFPEGHQEEERSGTAGTLLQRGHRVRHDEIKGHSALSRKQCTSA